MIGPHAHGVSCQDPIVLQKKISQLKMEVACSSGPSLHACRDYLIEPKSLPKVPPYEHEDRCELEPIGLTTPISTLAQKLGGEEELLKKYHGNWYVNSVEDFYEHTRLHVERVKALGLELFRTHPEMFKGLSEEQVRIALAAHDRAKLSPRAMSSQGKPFYEELFEKYRSKPDLQIIQELNSHDEKFMDDAYRLSGLGDNPQMTAAERARRKALREQLKKIERLADYVDRGSSYVTAEEFGRPMKPASYFLTDPDEKRLAKELEGKYQKITSHLDYKVLDPSSRKMLGRKLRMDAKFASIVKKENVAKISARALGYQVLKRGKSGMLRVLGALSSTVAKKIFLAADFIGLYFGDMDRLGCDGIGYHDWVKDPNCEPAIGLTPKVIQLLNEDPSTQMHYLKTQASTCRVINETYALSIEKPHVKSCQSSLVEVEIGDKKHVKVHLDKNQKIKEIELGQLGQEAVNFFRGVPEKVSINSAGAVSEACFVINGKERIRTCVGQNKKDAKDLNKISEFIKTINFPLQKAIVHCSSLRHK